MHGAYVVACYATPKTGQGQPQHPTTESGPEPETVACALLRNDIAHVDTCERKRDAQRANARWLAPKCRRVFFYDVRNRSSSL